MQLETLRARGELLGRLRQFFADEGLLEVETPIASDEIIPEQHIDPVRVASGKQWLQASPELHMKRLLCQGAGSIYQITRAFREGECGTHHNPEYTIVEWYRVEDDLAAGMAFADRLMQHVVRTSPAKQTTYREAFQTHCGLDPHLADVDSLAKCASRMGLDVSGMELVPASEARDEWLNLLMSACVEPKLGREGPELLYHYPASQAALAATTHDEQGVEVAERFEFFCGGLELMNGYRELTDADLLEERLAEVLDRRTSDHQPLTLPMRLLKAMREDGLPPSAGVAMGFDRLVMLATGCEQIDEVLPFAHEAYRA